MTVWISDHAARRFRERVRPVALDELVRLANRTPILSSPPVWCKREADGWVEVEGAILPLKRKGRSSYTALTVLTIDCIDGH